MIFITENSVQEVQNWKFEGREIFDISNEFREGLNPLFFLKHSKNQNEQNGHGEQNEEKESVFLCDNIMKQIEEHSDYIDLRGMQIKENVE